MPDADLLDAGAIFGIGFAPFLGGPLHYVRARGVDPILARLENLESKYGKRFTPDAGWHRFKMQAAENTVPAKDVSNAE